MKRAAALLLSLVLILGLVPITAQAGGGGAWLHWEEDFDDVTHFWDWQVIDANGDGLGFNTCREGGESFSVRSCEPLGMLSVEPKASDDYLISPAITLGAGYEYTLFYRVGGAVAPGAYSVQYEIYIYTGEEELTAANLYTLLGERAHLGCVMSNGWENYAEIDLTAYAGQSFRLVFRSCNKDAGALWLDDVRVYCQEPDELLGKVTAMNVPMPAAGVNVRDLREGYIFFPSFANYTLVRGSMKWYKTVDEVPVEMVDEEFNTVDEYTMSFRVKPKEGITTTSTGVASVNGMSASFRPMDDGTVVVSYALNRRLGEPQEVRDVHIRLDEPVPGGRPDRVAERWLADGSTDFHYEVIDIDWSPWTGVFEQGESYAVSVTVRPREGYAFADFVHATLNGEPVALEESEYGLTFTREWEFIEPEYVTVTFSGNGHGTPPDPIRVPYGGCVWDVIDSFMEVNMEDADGLVFWDWSDIPHCGRYDWFSFNDPIYEDITLYAMWLDPITEMELWLDPPAPGDSPDEMKLSLDRFDNITLTDYGWYTDEACNNPATAFLPGATYYGDAIVTVDEFHSPWGDQNIIMHGATALGSSCSGPNCHVKFKVTLPRPRTTLSAAGLWVDTPVPGAGMDMAPAIYCLTPGVDLVTEGDWWDSPDAVGDYDCVWGGGFVPGKTLYTVVTVETGEYAFAPINSFQASVSNAEFCRFDGYSANNGIRIVLAVDVPEAYCFTVWADGPGSFLFSGEYGLTKLCDFAFVRAGEYTLTAFPDPNCTFAGWYAGDTLLTADPVYTFTMTDHVENWRAVFTETEVDRIDVTVPIPAPGDEFSFFCQTAGAEITNGAPVELLKDVWYNEWGVSGAPLPFQVGRKYFVELDFEALDGACLTENTQVYINGKLAETWHQANVDTWYACSGNYTMNPFKDVAEGKYYYDAVMWAIAHDPQITSGTGDGTTFSPNATCTRAQVMTFLWHALNDPAPLGKVNPFTDVKEGKYYYYPVLWAFYHDPQITGGATETTFGINNPCKREQVVTFLWKAAGAPEPTTTNNPFTDVKADKYYYKAVLWAVENGITSGTSATTFGVGKTCTRAQIVTFLYAAYGN